MEDNKFWISVWIIAGFTIVGIVTVSLFFNERMNRDYMEHGYSQRIMLGYGAPVWTKGD